MIKMFDHLRTDLLHSATYMASSVCTSFPFVLGENDNNHELTYDCKISYDILKINRKSNLHIKHFSFVYIFLNIVIFFKKKTGCKMTLTACAAFYISVYFDEYGLICKILSMILRKKPSIITFLWQLVYACPIEHLKVLLQWHAKSQ